MSENIMQNYIKLTENEIIEYIKLIFEKSYNRKITLMYLDAYKDVRFYKFYPKDDNLTFRKNYLNAIKEKKDKIIDKIPTKKKLIENMGLFFYYILYFDKISYRIDIEEIVLKLYKIRKKILKKDNEDFKIKFIETYNKYLKEKNDFLDKFKTDDFYLKITRYEGISNVHRINIKYNIKFPEIFSTNAIEKVFNNGIVAENKLIIEYSLGTLEIIEDIMKGNFKKQYIVEFNTNLLKKTRKLNQLLKIIDNPAIQDKVNLKITYKEFKENKEEIYNLMRLGYRFAIVLDKNFEPDYINFEKLNVFNYVIASRKLDYYDEVVLNEKIINNLIKI